MRSSKEKKPKMWNITPDILRDTFRVDNLENYFIVFDDLKDIIFQNGKVNDEVCNIPCKSKEAIMAVCTGGRFKAKIGIKEIEVEEQNMLVIMPEQIFEIIEITPDCSVIVIVIKDIFFDIRNNLSEIKELQQYILKEQRFFIPEQNMQEFLTLYGLVRMKLATPNKFTPQIIQHYCYIMFYNCYALYKQKEAEQQIVNKEQKEIVFERFIREVEIHFKEQHTVGFYADKLCITPKYLSLLIKETSGKTAADWIREYLVIEARAWLKSGRMTVQQVSNELNFADQSHFGNFFKRYTGYSPREYQQK
jgi:AraC-like DNA-binding protein